MSLYLQAEGAVTDKSLSHASLDAILDESKSTPEIFRRIETSRHPATHRSAKVPNSVKFRLNAWRKLGL
jgi:hypothetical protein